MKSSSELCLRSDALRGPRGILAALLCGACLAAPATGAQPPLPDRAASSAILEQFRRSIWAEPVFAEFELREMPRRGDEHVFHGRFWGGRDADGPATRLEMEVGKGGYSHRILVQGGPNSSVWTSDGPGAGTPDEKAELAPLVPGVEMTPFDVLPMPYLYWLDAELVSVDRIRGRPANAFIFTPSADFLARNPSVRSVRTYLDTQYDALVQSEIIGPAGRVAKTLSLLELRKVGDRWIPKDVDVRDEATRDKTRLTITAVAVGIPPAPEAFDPDHLGSPLAPPPAARVIRINP